MAYEPLHHKYRPQRFDQLVGQEAIATTLSSPETRTHCAGLSLQRFKRDGKIQRQDSGPLLNCLSSESQLLNPAAPVSFAPRLPAAAPDVIEIDAASNTGVDNIRDLIERSRFAPVQARWKVYVVDECHMLSTAAFNALLKTLEEPHHECLCAGHHRPGCCQRS